MGKGDIRRSTQMVFLKHGTFRHDGGDDAFDTLVPPDAITPFSGIYRCEVCGQEVISRKGSAMPSADHHQHPYHQRAIRWRLIVRTIRRKDPGAHPSSTAPDSQKRQAEAPRFVEEHGTATM